MEEEEAAAMAMAVKRPKIKGNFTPAKRGIVKTLIFHSFASIFGSESEAATGTDLPLAVVDP